MKLFDKNTSIKLPVTKRRDQKQRGAGVAKRNKNNQIF